MFCSGSSKSRPEDFGQFERRNCFKNRQNISKNVGKGSSRIVEKPSISSGDDPKIRKKSREGVPSRGRKPQKPPILTKIVDATKTFGTPAKNSMVELSPKLGTSPFVKGYLPKIIWRISKPSNTPTSRCYKKAIGQKLVRIWRTFAPKSSIFNETHPPPLLFLLLPRLKKRIFELHKLFEHRNKRQTGKWRERKTCALLRTK